MSSRYTVLYKSQRPGWQPPLVKRMRKAYGMLSRAHSLTWYSAAPETVTLRIERAEMLLLEALEIYEPWIKQQIEELRRDYIIKTGNPNSPEFSKSPHVGLKTLDGIGTDHDGGPDEG